MIRQSIEMLSPFAEKLNELLAINEHTDLIHLAPAIQEQVNGIFSLFRSSPARILNPEVLARKVENWTSYLVDQWMHNKDNPPRQEKIRIVSIKIKTERKIAIIREKILRLNVHNERLETSLSQLEHRIDCILEIPLAAPVAHNIIREEPLLPSFELSSSPPDSGDSLIARSFSDTDLSRPLLSPRYERRFKRHANACLLDMCVKKEQERLEIEKIHQLFEKLKNASNIELIKAFSELQGLAERRAFGLVIRYEQLVPLLEAGLNDSDYHRYVPRILIMLNFQTLVKVLLGASSAQINMLNRLFRDCPDLKEDWFIEQYQKQREFFSKKSNECSEKIDQIDARLRQIEKSLVRSYHNVEMDMLVAEISQHKAAFKLYKQLVTNVFHDSVTVEFVVGTKDRMSELDKEYKRHLNRMSQLAAEYNQENGCPYKYLHGKVFKDDQLDDDDEAGEIFASFSICSISDYEEVGLITQIPEQMKSRWRLDPLDGHRMARSLALETLCHVHRIAKCEISMWKQLRIWNKWMLQEHLSRPEIKPYFTYSALAKRKQQANPPAPMPRFEDID